MTIHLVVKTPTSCVPLSHFPKNQWSLNITSQPSTCETAKKKKKTCHISTDFTPLESLKTNFLALIFQKKYMILFTTKKKREEGLLNITGL